MPFSEWSTTFTPSGRWLGINVGNPIPKFTYSPSTISAAARAAICSRDQLMLRPFRPERGAAWCRSAASCAPDRSCRHRPLLDSLVLRTRMHHPLDENTRQMNLGRIEFSGLDELFDLRDGDPSGHRRQRVEI